VLPVSDIIKLVLPNDLINYDVAIEKTESTIYNGNTGNVSVSGTNSKKYNPRHQRSGLMSSRSFFKPREGVSKSSTFVNNMIIERNIDPSDGDNDDDGYILELTSLYHSDDDDDDNDDNVNNHDQQLQQNTHLLPLSRTNNTTSSTYHAPAFPKPIHENDPNSDDHQSIKTRLNQFFFTCQTYKPLGPMFGSAPTGTSSFARSSNSSISGRSPGSRGDNMHRTNTNGKPHPNRIFEHEPTSTILPAYSNHDALVLTPPVLKQARTLYFSPIENQDESGMAQTEPTRRLEKHHRLETTLLTTSRPQPHQFTPTPPFHIAQFIYSCSIPIACIGLPYLYYHMRTICYPTLTYHLSFFLQVPDLALWRLLWAQKSPILDPSFDENNEMSGQDDHQTCLERIGSSLVYNHDFIRSDSSLSIYSLQRANSVLYNHNTMSSSDDEESNDDDDDAMINNIKDDILSIIGSSHRL